MNKIQKKNIMRERRHKRIRAKIAGTIDRPRLSVFKSNRYVYVQLVNDDKGETLASFSSAKAKGTTMKEKAKETGKEIARLAKEKNILKVVFDRGGYMYEGMVETVADGAREGGLVF
jgi:large subunit ribosomal protein L18